jgi:hypothetical protein
MSFWAQFNDEELRDTSVQKAPSPQPLKLSPLTPYRILQPHPATGQSCKPDLLGLPGFGRVLLAFSLLTPAIRPLGADMDPFNPQASGEARVVEFHLQMRKLRLKEASQ